MAARTLIFEIALPDYYLEDWDETLSFYKDHDGANVATFDIIANESGLCSSRVNLSLLLGDKGGTFVERVKGQIIAARVVERAPEHKLSDDSRLDELERP